MFKLFSSWKLTSVLFLIHALILLVVACVAAYWGRLAEVPILAVATLAIFGLSYGFNRMSKNDKD